MKKVIVAVALLAATGLMSFTHVAQGETVNTTVVSSGKIQVKIKNDTGADHKVITSSGGSTNVPDQSGVTTITVEVGDTIFLYDGGKKGAKLFVVEVSMDGKTVKLSEFL
jgi:hypothetical protein